MEATTATAAQINPFGQMTFKRRTEHENTFADWDPTEDNDPEIITEAIRVYDVECDGTYIGKVFGYHGEDTYLDIFSGTHWGIDGGSVKDIIHRDTTRKSAAIELAKRFNRLGRPNYAA